MTDSIIQVPRIVEGREFYGDSVAEALDLCQGEGYEAQFMPAVLDARIHSSKDSRIWRAWFLAPIRATGRTNQGSAVVVYAHVPNYFSEPANIRKAVERELVNCAGILPRGEFQRLVDLDGLADSFGNRLVWLVDYDKLKSSKSGVIPVKDALEHPQTIPFCAGQERAEKYLAKHREVFGDEIGNWHSDELYEEPLARLLRVGYSYYNDGLSGDNSLDGSGRFVGVKKTGEANRQTESHLEISTKAINFSEGLE